MHLEFNGISIEKMQDVNYLILKGKTKKIDFVLSVIWDEYSIFPESKEDSLVILNITKPGIVFPKSFAKNIMFIDIFNKQRIGTSNVGEEFVKFVSRYGLRFSRLD